MVGGGRGQGCTWLFITACTRISDSKTTGCSNCAHQHLSTVPVVGWRTCMMPVASALEASPACSGCSSVTSSAGLPGESGETGSTSPSSSLPMTRHTRRLCSAGETPATSVRIWTSFVSGLDWLSNWLASLLREH